MEDKLWNRIPNDSRSLLCPRSPVWASSSQGVSLRPALLAGPILQPSWPFCELLNSLSILPLLLGSARLGFHSYN